MAFIDYYKILGVDRSIPQEDVRKAYLKRAKQFHPDLHPDDPKAKAKFQALNEAFEVIGDPEKRRKYDQYGEKWREADAFNANGGGYYGGAQGRSAFDDNDFSSMRFGNSGGFSDFFEQLFGEGSGYHFASGSGHDMHASADVNVSVSIDLYTALLGGDIIIQLGDGSKVKLKVNPVVQNESKVRLRGKGHNRPDGSRGDLIITYKVKMPEELSERQKELVMQMRQG